MARTACWRMLDGKLVEKVVEGSEVPEGWFDNPRLEVIPLADPTPEREAEVVVAEPEGVVETVVVTNVVAEKVSEPDTQEEAIEEAAPAAEEAAVE